MYQVFAHFMYIVPFTSTCCRLQVGCWTIVLQAVTVTAVPTASAIHAPALPILPGVRAFHVHRAVHVDLLQVAGRLLDHRAPGGHGHRRSDGERHPRT